MEEEYETFNVIVTSMIEGTDAISIYNGIYSTIKTIVENLIDINFLYAGLYEEFSFRNNINGEKFTMPEDYECPICYTEGDIYFKFNCDHIVCAKCFASLLMNSHDRCPICRRDIVLGDCKINKTFETPPLVIPEDEIEDITAEYVNDFIFNIRSSPLW